MTAVGHAWPEPKADTVQFGYELVGGSRPQRGEMTLRAGGLGNGYYSDGNVAYRTRTTHTPRITGSNPGRPATEPSLLSFLV